VLFQRSRDVNCDECDVYGCFIDYPNALERVQHGKMVEILKNIRIIINLYWN